MNQVIKDDLAAIKAEFAIPRRTRIEDGAEAVYVENEISVQELFSLWTASAIASFLINLPTNATRRP